MRFEYLQKHIFTTQEADDNASEFRITSSATVESEGKSKKKSRPLRNVDAPASAVSALRNTSDFYTPENLEAMKKLQMNYNAPKKQKEPHPQGNPSDPIQINTHSDLDDEDRMDTDSFHPSEEVILNAEQADAFEDEEDEEIKRWEMEQIKKGNFQNLIHKFTNQVAFNLQKPTKLFTISNNTIKKYLKNAI